MGTVYYPCAVSRSDGCRETATGRDGSKEPNTPTANQKDDTPKATNDPKDPGQLKYVVDCYKKLDDNDLKAIEWRRKLGGMLMSILTKDNKELKRRNWILKELPEGYELWEHLKYKVTYRTVNGKEKQTDGNFERQDAYLYGHPQGRKKRYRSPADFLPHLLWLAVDKEGDSKNCSCKVCSPDASDEQMDEVKGEDSTLQPSINTDSKEQVIIPSRSQPPPQANAPAVALSTPRLQPPAPKHGPSPEQLYDSQSGGSYLYRPGELVWWENEPSNNWRLGVISRRGLMNNAPRYFVQPLSNPYEAQNPRILNKESSLRPWLAWSLPPTTIPILQSKGFDDVPWDRVVRGDFDQNQSKEYVVDGSILAARSIDASYSFFDRNESALAGPGEVHYNGMFLGGEKLWVGEPVRMRGPPAAASLAPDILVLVVHKLIERTTHTGSSVTIIGEVYKWVEMPTPYTSRTQWPTPNLPPRMVADLRFRNEIADNAKTGMWYEWRLLDPLAKKSLLDIKGRWYETKNLLPTLAGATKFRQDVALGKLLDANEWMNARLDNNPVPEQRRKNRADTFGRAVPPEFKVSRGLAGDPADDLFPDQMQANMEQYMEMGQGQSQQQQQFYAGSIQH
ncbi:transcription-silencing protein Clr2 [Drepanopeziza brunnea f. sp. 'multigermtubi' MB_m1]|uniref:Transcription-silencing protein Clr2 n=2 Tax=Drepanopeziza brunnea f. sp. 'multigermtubi' TaxID=698441 RepID=K1WWI7_MARBU|nr:transcription-silencing protein Clr2 [Drepanopeziza brunnea f. sp. 'multigermtubi' MB_m1]EKD17436.1 transcription-silencing protein Clr2 [Drepanopeziza brunnea f. sp. 'multigermtubi' MB_m1]